MNKLRGSIFLSTLMACSALPLVAVAGPSDVRKVQKIVSDGTLEGDRLVERDNIHAADTEEEGVPRLLEVPESVRETKLAEHDLWMHLGITGDVTYSDNVFKDQGNGEEDFIFRLMPRLKLRSDWAQHMVGMQLSTEHGMYMDNSRADYNDGRSKLYGRYDFNKATSLSGYGEFRYDHINIGSFLDEPDRVASEPTTYRYGKAGVILDHYINAYQLTAGAETSLYNYDNTNRTDGSRNINDDRDRLEQLYWLRAGVDVAPDTQFYVKGSGNMRRYDEQIDSSAIFKHDSTGYRAVAGIEFGMRPSYLLGSQVRKVKYLEQPVWVDAYAGYMRQDYDSSYYKNIGTFALGADARWQPSKQWRFKGKFERTVEEDALSYAASHIRSEGRLGAEYRPVSDWRLGVDGRYTHNDFQVNPASGRAGRLDQTYDGSLYAMHHLNKDWSVGGEFIHVKRDSNRADVEYDSNAFMLRAIAGRF